MPYIKPVCFTMHFFMESSSVYLHPSGILSGFYLTGYQGCGQYWVQQI